MKAFLQGPLEHARFPYVYLDATYLHGRFGQNMQVVSRGVVVAIGINALGYREVLGIAVGDSEAEDFWRQFLGSLKEQGLAGTRLVISDAHLGLTAVSSGCSRAAAGVAPRGALHCAACVWCTSCATCTPTSRRLARTWWPWPCRRQSAGGHKRCS